MYYIICKIYYIYFNYISLSHSLNPYTCMLYTYGTHIIHKHPHARPTGSISLQSPVGSPTHVLLILFLCRVLLAAPPMVLDKKHQGLTSHY